MWYIFPQLAGLGASPMSRRYAIDSLEEAQAFLDHPTLGENYHRLVDAVWHQVVELGVTVHALFGSPDDAKLVSSLTLFGAAAAGSRTKASARGHIDDILRAAEEEGLPRCAVTERFLRGTE